MVKDHSDSERENALPPHGLLFPISSKGYFICTIPRTGNTYHGICYTSHGHWLEREIAQWVHPMKDRSDDQSHHERTLLPWSLRSPFKKERYLIRQNNTTYTFSRMFSFSSIGQDKSKLQKQISKLLILTETAAWPKYRVILVIWSG